MYILLFFIKENILKKIKKQKSFKIITILLIICILIILLFISFQYYSSIKSKVIINTKNTISSSNDNAKTGNIGSFEYMQKYYNYAHKINNQVIGWIYINGTDINYPILHGSGDNYYLDHNWQGESFWNGCIALDEDNTSLNNNILLINGHNMLNGIMFSQLTKYENMQFAKKYNIVKIYNGITNKIADYTVFSAIYTEPNVVLNLGNSSLNLRKRTIDMLLNKKIYEIGNYNGHNILFLNTCLSNGTNKHIVIMCEEI